MFATTFFLGSFLFIHISVVPVLSSCPESFTATNVSALGLTVSPVYTRSSDCDCKCVVGVDSNINTSLPAGKLHTCSQMRTIPAYQLDNVEKKSVANKPSIDKISYIVQLQLLLFHHRYMQYEHG